MLSTIITSSPDGAHRINFFPSLSFPLISTLEVFLQTAVENIADYGSRPILEIRLTISDHMKSETQNLQTREQQNLACTAFVGQWIILAPLIP